MKKIYDMNWNLIWYKTFPVLYEYYEESNSARNYGDSEPNPNSNSVINEHVPFGSVLVFLCYYISFYYFGQ